MDMKSSLLLIILLLTVLTSAWAQDVLGKGMVGKRHVLKEAKKDFDVGKHDVKKARSLVKIIQGAGKAYTKQLKVKAMAASAPTPEPVSDVAPKSDPLARFVPKYKPVAPKTKPVAKSAPKTKPGLKISPKFKPVAKSAHKTKPVAKSAKKSDTVTVEVV